MVAIRPKGARRFGRPQRLSARPGGAIDLAVAANGAAIAIWGIQDGIEFSVRPPGGRFGPPVTHGRDTDYGPAGFDVGMAADGSALITWDDEGGSAVALYRSGNGRLRRYPGFNGKDVGDVLSAVNERGDMAILWQTYRRHYSPDDGYVVVHESTLTAGSPTFSSRVVTDLDYDLGDSSIRLTLTALGESLVTRGKLYDVCPLEGSCTLDFETPIRQDQRYPLILVADEEGNVHAFWQNLRAHHVRGRRYVHSVRPPGGTFSKLTLAAQTNNATELDSAVTGPDGQILLGWTSYARTSASYTARFIPGVGWGPSLRVTPKYPARGPKQSYVVGLSLGVGPFGNGLAAWEVAHRLRFVPQSVFVSRLAPPPGNFSPTVDQSGG